MQSPAGSKDRSRMLARAATALLGAGESRDFLETVCSGEPELLAQALETLARPVTPHPPELPPAPGDEDSLVAGRFRLVRPLGQGGMAAVYEAIDLKLGERRALKFSKPGYASNIPPETRNALRVTHPNICRIHEIHGGAGRPDFISMEFIEGETLLDRWRREPLLQPEALAIARQLCAGLHAAHSAHLLHRDLKSGNVMLARQADGSLRAAIMDFGIARLFEEGESPDSAAVAGTPAYIAPELWHGAPATPAADVYSLGVVLFEMLAGELPFSAGTPWAIRLSRLPAAPSRSGRKPDRRWDPVVLRCLEPDPARRLATAAEVLAAIERAFRPRNRRRLFLGVAAAALLAATPLLIWRDRIWPPPLARLAILPFTGSSGEAGLDQAVRGGLIQAAAQIESLGASARRVVVIPLEESVRSEVATPQAAAERLGATHVLSGVVGRDPQGLSLRATVADARLGSVIREFNGEFRRADLAALSTALTGAVTSAFRLDRAPPARIAPAAYPTYAEGLAALRRIPADADRAVACFETAAQLDNSSPTIFGALAEACKRKYDDTRDSAWLDRAAAHARRAESLHPDSPPVLLVLGAIEYAQGRPELAVEHYRRASQLEPQNAEAWRRIGLAYQRLNRDADSTGALRQAIHLAPGYYLPHDSLGFVHFRAGRYSEAVEEYRTVTQLAPGFAAAWSSLGAILVATDRIAEAEPALRRSIQLRPSRPALNNLSVLLRYQGRHAEAVEVLQRALKAGADDTGLRLNLGNALRRVGRREESLVHFRRASELARAALLLDPRDSAARARLAYSLVSLGKRELAADEALQAARLSPSDYSVLFWSVMALEALGRRSDAFPLLAPASYEQLRDLRRQPDLVEFARDPRFTALLQQSESSRSRIEGK